MIQFTIPGKIEPQARPRFNRNTGTVYTPAKSSNFKKLVQQHAKLNKPDELLLGALRLEVEIFIMPPKNLHTKPKIAKIESNEILPTKKPDLDNLVKGIKDGITGIIWKDDAQIVQLLVKKFYSFEPRAEVRIMEV